MGVYTSVTRARVRAYVPNHKLKVGARGLFMSEMGKGEAPQHQGRVKGEDRSHGCNKQGGGGKGVCPR